MKPRTSIAGRAVCLAACLTAAMGAAQTPMGAGAAAGPAENPPQLAPETKRALFKAHELELAGKSAEAAAVLESHLREHPEEDGTQLRHALGVYLARVERFADAIPHLERAVALDPKQAPIWILLANLYYRIEQFEKAGEAYQSGYRVQAEPDPTVLYNAGVSFLLGKKPERSYRVLSELLGGTAASAEAGWYRAFVAAASEAGKERECWPILEGLVARDPDRIDSWRLLYQAAGSMQDYRRALITLTVIDYLQPLSAKETAQLGDLYLLSGVPIKAAAYYSRALQDSTAAGWRERLVSAYLEAHEPDRALSVLFEAVKRNPSAKLWSLLGDLHYQERRFEEAEVAYRESAALDPQHGRPHLMMGYCAYELDRPAEARTYLTTASEFPDTREAALRLLKTLAGSPSTQ